MKFKFEQLLGAAKALANKIPITVDEDNTIITLTRGATSIDLLRGYNEKLDLGMTIRFDPNGKKDFAVLCELDNAGTIGALDVAIHVARLFVNVPNKPDTIDNQKAMLNDIAALFERADKKKYH